MRMRMRICPSQRQYSISLFASMRSWCRQLLQQTVQHSEDRLQLCVCDFRVEKLDRGRVHL
eukprot:COSAG06_NODE_1908_length_8088_cov_2.473526_5_plen_61_part_00